jgi:hypothetical protein
MAMIDDELGVIVTPSPANPTGQTKSEAVIDIETAGKDVLTKVQETYDLVKPEVETITAGVLSSGKRLDAKPRVFSAVPNSLLVYGGIAVVLYLVLKK